MLFFMSYARRDHEKVNALAQRLRQLGHEQWLDTNLAGGQAWWDEILSHIRGSDVFLFAVSSAGLESEACARERAYAEAVGKPVLPVQVEAINAKALPRDLATLQMVNYSAPNEDAAFQLAGAIARLRPAAPLPDPLPPPPDVPVSYLSDISDRIHAHTLSKEEQFGLLGTLESALARAGDRDDGEEHAVVLGLLEDLERRQDLYAETDRRLRAVKQSGAGPRKVPPPAVTLAASVAPTAVQPAESSASAPHGQSRAVKVLAVIGAIFVALMMIGMCSAPGRNCYTDPYGNVWCG